METPNLKVIQQYAQGDAETEKMLLDIVIEEFPEEKENYYLHLEAKDAKKTQEAVHKIKHKISILGLEKSYEIANTYEANLLENNFDLQNEFHQILENITSFIASL
ncbi:Hpt domain-containing protein [Polaribacter sp. P097]|uniref:Hpt domain-containing protein n=1 Tax=Polaribacter sp. P097 TaxID=3117398 RepID=UPI002FE3B483